MQPTPGLAHSRPDPLQQTDEQLEFALRVGAVYPGVKVAHDATFEEVWDLFLESGFLYPEKVSRLDPVLPEIRHTVRTLIEANGCCFATVVLRDAATVDAHMSIVQTHERTWMVQHLAARPMSARRFDASARLTLGFTYYGRMRPDIGWVKMFFRPNNPWPSRVFGGFARRIADAPTSDLRTWRYLTASTAGPAAGTPSGIAVHPADASELPLVAEWFGARGRTVEVEANDLDPRRLGLPVMAAAYSRKGLHRRRECLVARRAGVPCGFALLEISSLGLNLSELTNTFTVHTMNEEDQATRLALILAARRRYADLGRAQCVALDEGAGREAFETAGFTSTKDYSCFIFHRDHLGDMEEYFLNLFGVRRRSAE